MQGLDRYPIGLKDCLLDRYFIMVSKGILLGIDNIERSIGQKRWHRIFPTFCSNDKYPTSSFQLHVLCGRGTVRGLSKKCTKVFLQKEKSHSPSPFSCCTERSLECNSNSFEALHVVIIWISVFKTLRGDEGPWLILNDW